MSECGHGHDLRSWICDAVGNHMISQEKQDALDVNYFEGIENQLQGQHNGVHEEMWTYYSKKYSHMTLDDIQRHWHTPKSHMLEVYCSDQSQLTQQGQNVGLSSYRF